MSPALALALAAFLVAAVLGFTGAWLYDWRVRSFPHDVITPKVFRASNLNVHATVALLVILQCGGGAGAPGPGQICSGKTTIKVNKTKTKVIAKASTRCQSGLREHDLWIELRHGERGVWQKQDHNRTREIPRPGKKVTVKVSSPCVPGEWRAVTQATAVDNKGEVFDSGLENRDRVVERGECR